MNKENSVIHSIKTVNGTVSINSLFGKYAVKVEYVNGGNNVIVVPTLKDAQIEYSYQRIALENYIPIPDTFQVSIMRKDILRNIANSLIYAGVIKSHGEFSIVFCERERDFLSHSDNFVSISVYNLIKLHLEIIIDMTRDCNVKTIINNQIKVVQNEITYHKR